MATGARQHRGSRRWRARLGRVGALLLAAGAGAGGVAGAAPHGRPDAPRVEPYAVVVHAAVPVAEVTLGQLRALFRGEQATWSDGARVVPIVQAPTGSAPGARALVLRAVYRMDEGAFKRYWIARTFRGASATGPTLVSSNALARRLTASIPGAVALVPASEAGGDGVRILRVDGRLPGEAGYALSGTVP